ncbi:MAG: succinylglutamate desuccinylase [Gemmatimonadales bacterium]|nr:succinylglutamate desuccinylase [Gemmatimonadales bacterium]
MIRSLLVLLLAAPPGAAIAQERGPFAVGPIVVQPGQQASGYLDVPAGVDDGTRIPVTVVHGAQPGPVLALIAGTHGYEYPPITALQQVRQALDAARLSGTVIMVHVANMPSFLGRTVYYSPVDGKNLNRVYPGRADGTVSDRIAHAVTTEVIDRADVVADLHCGDGNEALRPYTYWMVTGNAALDSASRGLAIAFGLDHIVIDRGRPHDPQASVYTSNTALTRGKPSITTETGQLGSNDAAWVSLAERGVWNLLRHLGMMPGEVERPGAIVWLDHYEVLRSPVTGIFRPAVRDGYAVAEGGLLGTLVDLFGDPIEEVRAPFAGVVNYVVATPPVREGEPLAMVSRVKEGQ